MASLELPPKSRLAGPEKGSHAGGSAVGFGTLYSGGGDTAAACVWRISLSAPPRSPVAVAMLPDQPPNKAHHNVHIQSHSHVAEIGSAERWAETFELMSLDQPLLG